MMRCGLNSPVVSANLGKPVRGFVVSNYEGRAAWNIICIGLQAAYL